MSVKKSEKKRRSDIIFGILLASTLGVILNLFSGLYYDLFITRTIKWSNVSQQHVMIWFLILLATWGFISFFVHDYENNLEMNKVLFWKRFVNYFFESFRPVKFLRILAGVYLVLFLLAILAVLLITAFIIISEAVNWWFASLVDIAILVKIIIYINKKYFKK